MRKICALYKKKLCPYYYYESKTLTHINLKILETICVLNLLASFFLHVLQFNSQIYDHRNNDAIMKLVFLLENTYYIFPKCRIIVIFISLLKIPSYVLR